MVENQGCCRWCASFIFTLGLTALFLWLSLRPSSPDLSIESFYVPALNKAANDSRNTNISFHFKLDNVNKDMGIYYDALNLSFYYGQNRSFSVGNFTVPGFYQGHKKKAHRWENVTTHGVPWKNATTEFSNGSVVFRVDVGTTVRYKIMAWKTKYHGIRVGGDVKVGADGQKQGKKGVLLKSGALGRRCYCARVGWLLLLAYFFFC